MSRPGQIDHVSQGLARVPEKLRGALGRFGPQRWLAVWLQPFNEIEELTQQVIDAIVEWKTTAATFDFVLELIGDLLGQPRPDGFNNDDYSFVLQARILVRRSAAVRDDVLRVARYLARDGSVQVFFLSPKLVIVQFEDVVLDAQWTALYYELLLGAIDAVDDLEVNYTTSASAGYDFGGYDEEPYV